MRVRWRGLDQGRGLNDFPFYQQEFLHEIAIVDLFLSFYAHDHLCHRHGDHVAQHYGAIPKFDRVAGKPA